MKKLLFLFILLAGQVCAQVGIGTNTPNATLEVTGKPAVTDEVDGFIPPKITLEQLTAKTGYGANQAGAVVYITSVSPSTTNSATAGIKQLGYYYFDGSKWQMLNANTSYKPVISNLIVNSASVNQRGRYIVPASGLLGSFAGQANQYADYDGNGFAFLAPTNGDYAQIVDGANIGKVFYYNGTSWVELSKTTPVATSNYNIANSYIANDLVIRNNKIYQANGNIPANTAFVLGTSGATWKRISEIADWVLTGVYEAGDIVKKDGLLYEANGNIVANTAFATGTSGATWEQFGGATGASEKGQVNMTSGSTLTANNTWQVISGLEFTAQSAGTFEVSTHLIRGGNSGRAYVTLSIDNVVQEGKSQHLGFGGAEIGVDNIFQLDLTAGQVVRVVVRDTENSSQFLNDGGYVFGRRPSMRWNKISNFLPASPVLTYSGTVTLKATTTNPTKPTSGIVKDNITVIDRGDGYCDVMFTLAMTATTGSNPGSGIYYIELPAGAPAIDLTEHPAVTNPALTYIEGSDWWKFFPFSNGKSVHGNTSAASTLGFIAHTSNSFIMVNSENVIGSNATNKVRSVQYYVGTSNPMSYSGSFRYKKQ